MRKKTLKRIGTASLAAAMSFSALGTSAINILANDSDISTFSVDNQGYNVLGSVSSMTQDENKITFNISTGERIRFTFLEEHVFRMYMAPEGQDFQDYPTPNGKDHTATITDKSDDQYKTEYSVVPVVTEDANNHIITTGKVIITIAKDSSLMKAMKSDGTIIWEEAAPLRYKNGSTVQTLKTNKDEYFYGGGTQNGRFSHKGNIITMDKGGWVDQGVASPNPFYWSTDGYGVLRNTWKNGTYDFGKTDENIVSIEHDEKRFDAYYFIDAEPVDILGDYYELTGKPAELPEYASYLGHLNCYNRDYWIEVPEGTAGAIKLGDKWYKESQTDNGGEKETLLGESNLTAQQIIEDHKAYDMPLGWFLPNDGYGCGYGQTDSQAGDIENLKDFSDYAIKNGVQTGLWTQSNLWPADATNPQKGERDIYKEVEAGVHSVKTDVAWVGPGYSFALNGISVAYDAIASKSGMKPNIVTLNGWAGTQRYGGIWTGDQYGGQWEYIRFHIPTYIGTALSGQPNIGSDMDGIFGGKNPTVWTRDFQWKAFTTYMLDMDGWGSNQKSPWAMGEDGTSINRTYLKLKAQLTPYTNKISHDATAKGGLPMIRAMFLEEKNDFTLGKATQYQYMWGDNFLVAPVYQETAPDGNGNDIRNDIYLPSTSNIWIDYFTGDQYRGGQILNNFDAPLWKLPVFVKNGSIIPMYSENNNPEPISATNTDGLDRSKRIVEFYPYGDTSFEAYEDDGKTLGGASTTTMLTSSVKNGTATLEAEKTVGSYTGMVKERSNEFIVNVSKAPTAVKGTVAGSDVTFTEVKTQEEYDNATGNVYFYNENPDIIVKKYASAGSNYANTAETTRPKLYVKSTEKVDITSNNFKVVVEGFENIQDLGVDELNEGLAVPTGLAEVEKTDSRIILGWNAVDTAETYDVEADGIVYRNIKVTEYVHNDLSYLTDHEYRVRAVNKNGYSNWSEPITIQTADNPYRNVPEFTASFAGGSVPKAYAGKFENMFDLDNKSEYSSANGGEWKDQSIILDLKSAYPMDKLEYICRENMGNGAVKQWLLEYSNDGKNWTTYGEINNDVKNSVIVEDNEDGRLFTHTFTDNFRARYLKLTVKNSTGGFLQAYEIRPFKVDNAKAQLPGDGNNSGAIDDNDLIFYQNYMGITPDDSDYEYVTKSIIGDIDGNQMIDGYDISYVARQLGNPVDDATAATGVEGKIELIPSKTDIKAGDVITVDVYGIGLKNVNAFSVEIPVDKDQFRTSAASATISSMFMKNLSQERIHSSGKVDNYVSFVNIGKQDLINGTGSIAKITVTANADFTWDTKATHAVLVGQDLSKTDALIDNTITPVPPKTVNLLSFGDIQAIATKDIDGTVLDSKNIWQQSNWNNILMDGDKTQLAEFKWITDTTRPNFPDEVKVPMDLEFTFKNAQPLSKVSVYNRVGAGSNGSVTSIKAVAYSGEEAYDLGSFNKYQEVYEFTLPETRSATMIDRVVITPLSTNGSDKGLGDKGFNRMLSLREIEFETDSTVYAEGIQFSDDSATYVTLNSLAQVSANVTPNNASNPFYEITSSDESIAKVVKVPTETAYYYAIQGVSEGTVTLTATAEGKDKDGKTLSTSMEFTVKDGVDTAKLDENIDAFNQMYGNLYTTETYHAVKTLAAQAEALKAKENVTQTEIDNITMSLIQAVKALEFKGSNDSQPSSANLIEQSKMTRYDESSMSAAEKEDASYVIDGNADTIWHSNYNKGYTLPQYVTIDLGNVYLLEQVNMLPRQNSSNGHITHYRIEVSTDEGDNKTFTPVVEGFLANDGTSLDSPGTEKEIKFDKTSARYVRFIALESLGGTPNAYASIAELNFFGLLDMPTLSEAIASAEVDLAKTDQYTSSSLAILKEAYDAAKALTSPSQEEAYAATVQILNAQKALKARAEQWLLDQVNDNIEKYSAMKDNYTADEFVEMAKAIEDAKALMATDKTDISLEQASLVDLAMQTAYINLDKAASAETLLANLTSVIAIANQTLTSDEILDVRPAQIEALRTAVEEGQALIDGTSDDRIAIMNSITSITKATQELWKIVNKEALENLIALAEKHSGNFTEGSKAELDAAIAEAKAALDDNATTDQVTQAYTRLTNAINSLKPAANKDALGIQLGITEKIVAHIDDYISSTVAGLEDLLAQAKAVYDNAEVSQAKVDEMTTLLTNANMAARTKADKTALQEAIAKANAMDLSGYSASTVAALQNAVDNASRIMENEYASQDEVDMAVAAIQTAIDKLAPSTDTPGGDEPTNPEDPTTPGTDDGNSNGSQTTPTTPSTGDTTNSGGWLLFLLASAGSIVALKKTTTKKEEK